MEPAQQEAQIKLVTIIQNLEKNKKVDDSFVEVKQLLNLLTVESLNNTRSSEKNNLLALAIRYGRDNIVGLLLNKGMRRTEINDRGESALTMACKLGNAETVKILLENVNPFTVFIKESDGNNPFAIAAESGSEEILTKLLEKGSKFLIDAKERATGLTPLDLAAKGGHSGCIRQLLIYGAEPYKTTPVSSRYPDYSPLTFAIESGNPEAVDAFLEGVRFRVGLPTVRAIDMKLALEKVRNFRISLSLLRRALNLKENTDLRRLFALTTTKEAILELVNWAAKQEEVDVDTDKLKQIRDIANEKSNKTFVKALPGYKLNTAVVLILAGLAIALMLVPPAAPAAPILLLIAGVVALGTIAYSIVRGIKISSQMKKLGQEVEDNINAAEKRKIESMFPEIDISLEQKPVSVETFRQRLTRTGKEEEPQKKPRETIAEQPDEAEEETTKLEEKPPIR